MALTVSLWRQTEDVGTGHLTFKRSDLIDQMNDIIAKHYRGCWRRGERMM
ncbi:DUF4942 domain-containing protein [Pectobacterium punjabense]|nr:DUF4942 domain-containing protein [Pectobacterium punjabense]MBN3135836.1 DUF4942 domain-containing protein [Pectobacterium punjabense]